MDKERYDLTNQLYDIANDKFKVDDWIKELEEDQQTSVRVSDYCDEWAKKRQDAFDKLSPEEQELKRETHGIEMNEEFKQLFQFHYQHKARFQTLFKTGEHDLDTQNKFNYLYEQFTKDFK